ncbi:MAG: radical SAM protein, partial [Clostridia bacterium]|nr:radical SAM protein [Clostridia bacterium]
SAIFFELQEKGAENINLVTPTHFVPQIIEAIHKAKEKGLCLPIVYNTSGYETEETLDSLRGIVDVYLTDFKYFSEKLSARYSNAKDYPETAKKALKKMVEQQPEPVFKDGMLKKGVIVRHLVLPGCIIDSKAVLKYVFQSFGENVLVSIMRQFTPYKLPEKYVELNRKITDAEYASVIRYAEKLGIENGFVQEKEAAEESFIPPFTYEGV